MMNRNVSIMMIILLLAASCSIPRGLPAPRDLPHETKGAAVYVKLNDGSVFRGELIAADIDTLFVLPADNRYSSYRTGKGLVEIPWNSVNNYRLYYARGKSLSGVASVYSLMTISHGWFSVLTMPVNLTVTILAHYSSINEHVLRKHDITPGELSLFARFPQGIPYNVSSDDIY